MDNNNDNRFQDYSAPEETKATTPIYAADQQPAGGYNLNGQYYTDSSENYDAGNNMGDRQYQGQNTYTGGMPQNNNAYNNGAQNFNSNTTSGYTYGNGNYGMGFDAVPLDKKGRPLRNRFGMKLTFSILGILFGLFFVLGKSGFAIVPLILSIGALIATCMQNGTYKQRNWDSFRTASKTATVLLWILFGVWIVYVILFIIGLFFILSFADNVSKWRDSDINDDDSGYYYDYSDDNDDFFDTDDDTSSKKSESGGFVNTHGEYITDVPGFNQFEMDGTVIELPMSVEDFCAAGFTLLEENANEELDANDWYGYAYYSAEGNSLGTIFVYNTTDSTIKVKQGTIGGITIYDDGETDLELLGGLEFGDSMEDAGEVFGTTVTYLSESDDDTSIDWYFKKGGYSTSIELCFDEYGEMNSVWIMNYDELE